MPSTHLIPHLSTNISIPAWQGGNKLRTDGNLLSERKHPEEEAVEHLLQIETIEVVLASLLCCGLLFSFVFVLFSTPEAIFQLVYKHPAKEDFGHHHFLFGTRLSIDEGKPYS